MANYILKRLGSLILVLLGVTFFTYILIYVVPGDPVLNIVGERANKETIIKIKKQLDLDKPFLVRYFQFIKKSFTLDFGKSFINNQKVSLQIFSRFPKTLMLAFSAIIIASLLGLVLGTLTAVYYNSKLDKFFLSLSTAAISIPVFFSALILIYFFAIFLHLLPAGGFSETNFSYLILPALTLGIRPAAYLMRLTRSYVLTALQSEYTIFARAKGLNESYIIIKHCLPNALLPIITVIGLDFGSYLNGSIITETIFSWPGIGNLAYQAILKRDIPLIMGCVTFSAFIFVIINLLVDLIYFYLNPKLRETLSETI